MRTHLWLLVAVNLTAGCGGNDPDPAAAVTEAGPSPRAVPQRAKQVTPPIDLKAPPAGASKTESGLRYTRLVTRHDGAPLPAGHTAMIRYTGWWQRSGETFFTTTERGLAIDPASAAPAFRQTLPVLRKGEKVMLWVPAAEGSNEPVVYEIELVDVVAPAPAMTERAAGDGAAPHQAPSAVPSPSEVATTGRR